MTADTEGWIIGDTRPCGCKVVDVSAPCDFHEDEYGYAQDDCGACESEVPGVWHTCDEGEDILPCSDTPGGA